MAIVDPSPTALLLCHPQYMALASQYTVAAPAPAPMLTYILVSRKEKKGILTVLWGNS